MTGRRTRSGTRKMVAADIEEIKRSLDDLKLELNDSFIKKIVVSVGELFHERLTKLEEENASLKKSNELLLERVRGLEGKVEDVVASSYVESDYEDDEDDDDCEINDVFEVEEHVDRNPDPTRKKFVQTLVLSDSIMKHVDPTKMEPMSGMEIMNVSIPGARCPRLLAELAHLSIRYEFGEVIVHVGTNYLPHEPAHRVAQEIKNFLSAICDFLPETTKVTFSSILPRTSDRFLRSVNNINQQIYYFCAQSPHRLHYLWYPYFARSHSTIINQRVVHLKHGINKKLYCWDAVHLSHFGVDHVMVTLREHIIRHKSATYLIK